MAVSIQTLPCLEDEVAAKDFCVKRKQQGLSPPASLSLHRPLKRPRRPSSVRDFPVGCARNAIAVRASLQIGRRIPAASGNAMAVDENAGVLPKGLPAAVNVSAGPVHANMENVIGRNCYGEKGLIRGSRLPGLESVKSAAANAEAAISNRNLDCGSGEKTLTYDWRSSDSPLPKGLLAAGGSANVIGRNYSGEKSLISGSRLPGLESVKTAMSSRNLTKVHMVNDRRDLEWSAGEKHLIYGNESSRLPEIDTMITATTHTDTEYRNSLCKPAEKGSKYGNRYSQSPKRIAVFSSEPAVSQPECAASENAVAVGENVDVAVSGTCLEFEHGEEGSKYSCWSSESPLATEMPAEVNASMAMVNGSMVNAIGRNSSGEKCEISGSGSPGLESTDKAIGSMKLDCHSGEKVLKYGCRSSQSPLPKWPVAVNVDTVNDSRNLECNGVDKGLIYGTEKSSRLSKIDAMITATTDTTISGRNSLYELGEKSLKYVNAYSQLPKQKVLSAPGNAVTAAINATMAFSDRSLECNSGKKGLLYSNRSSQMPSFGSVNLELANANMASGSRKLKYDFGENGLRYGNRSSQSPSEVLPAASGNNPMSVNVDTAMVSKDLKCNPAEKNLIRESRSSQVPALENARTKAANSDAAICDKKSECNSGEKGFKYGNNNSQSPLKTVAVGNAAVSANADITFNRNLECNSGEKNLISGNRSSRLLALENVTMKTNPNIVSASRCSQSPVPKMLPVLGNSSTTSNVHKTGSRNLSRDSGENARMYDSRCSRLPLPTTLPVLGNAKKAEIENSSMNLECDSGVTTFENVTMPMEIGNTKLNYNSREALGHGSKCNESLLLKALSVLGNAPTAANVKMMSGSRVSKCNSRENSIICGSRSQLALLKEMENVTLSANTDMAVGIKNSECDSEEKALVCSRSSQCSLLEDCENVMTAANADTVIVNRNLEYKSYNTSRMYRLPPLESVTTAKNVDMAIDSKNLECVTGEGGLMSSSRSSQSPLCKILPVLRNTMVADPDRVSGSRNLGRDSGEGALLYEGRCSELPLSKPFAVLENCTTAADAYMKSGSRKWGNNSGEKALIRVSRNLGHDSGDKAFINSSSCNQSLSPNRLSNLGNATMASNADMAVGNRDLDCNFREKTLTCGGRNNRLPQLPKARPTLRSKASNKTITKLTRLTNFFLDADTIHRCHDDQALAAAQARADVKRVLHDFDRLRRFFAQSNESASYSHMQAASHLRKKGRWVNCHKKWIGDVPGIEVGDQFYYRIEMCMIGLHRQLQAGIDFIPGSQTADGKCIATSIIASGGYEDDVDDGETILYTGQGGNNYAGDKRQSQDQKLVRGNLALRNSYRRASPVRVIRGCQEMINHDGCQRKGLSLSRTIYNYDGMYLVSSYWSEKGKSGFLVYKFLLKRMDGQPKLGSALVKFLGDVKKKKVVRLNIVMDDISEGRENKPVCVVNEVDDEPGPTYFTYVPKVLYPNWLDHEMGTGCDCIGECTDPSLCLCAARNGGCFPYEKDGGLRRRANLVYECGINCKCSDTCHNRVSQKGLKYRLEIFKTKNRGWGVRSWDSIPYGGFICEYTGELLLDTEAEQRVGDDEYLFDIGLNRNVNNTFGDVSDLIDSNLFGAPAVCNALSSTVENSCFTIDAAKFGNVARFINHSCSPNLIAQDVVFDHYSLDHPHIMLFSMDNIPPLTELTYDYNYTVGTIHDSQGNAKRKDCLCGSVYCRGRLY